MDEPALDAERLDCPQAGIADLFGQIFHQIVNGIAAIVDNVHQRAWGHIAGLKQGFPPGVHNGVIGLDIAVDKLLHDVNIVILVVDEEVKLLIVMRLVGVVGAHAVVRLDHHGIPNLLREGGGILIALHQMIPGSGQACLGIIGLHGGFELNLVHFIQLGAGGNIELGAQSGILHQPVLVVALQPVDFTVLKGEKRNGLEYLVVVFKVGNLIVFVQRVFQFLGQIAIGAVSDAQNAHSVFLQLSAEFPVGQRKIGGNKDKIFHKGQRLLFYILDLELFRPSHPSSWGT